MARTVKLLIFEILICVEEFTCPMHPDWRERGWEWAAPLGL